MVKLSSTLFYTCVTLYLVIGLNLTANLVPPEDTGVKVKCKFETCLRGAIWEFLV